MKIQRYDITDNYGCEDIVEQDDGIYVDYYDHRDKVENLEDKIEDLEKENETLKYKLKALEKMYNMF